MAEKETAPSPLTQQIALAAINAAGPIGDDEGAWNDKVSALASKIAHDLSYPYSPVRQAVEAVTEADKAFRGTIVKVQREKSSTRAKVTIKTKESKWAPDGLEYFRTERTDEPERGGLALAKQLSRLVGHKVFVYLEMQETKAGEKVRIVKAVADLGADPDAQQPE